MFQESGHASRLNRFDAQRQLYLASPEVEAVAALGS